MSAQPNLYPQYVTDDQDSRTAVLLPLSEYEELLEDLDDLAVAAERKNEPTVPHAQVVEAM